MNNKPLTDEDREARYQAWVASGCGESEPAFHLKNLLLNCLASLVLLGSIAWISYLFFTRV
jgi:hypothetical protein